MLSKGVHLDISAGGGLMWDWNRDDDEVTMAGLDAPEDKQEGDISDPNPPVADLGGPHGIYATLQHHAWPSCLPLLPGCHLDR